MIAYDINYFFVRVSFIRESERRKRFFCGSFQNNINVLIRKLFAKFGFHFPVDFKFPS